MNKIIIATDSFKGTLSAAEACQIIAEEAQNVFPQAEILQLPIADGGEGLVEALLSNKNGEMFWVDTLDPLGRPIRASYAMLDDGSALLEMASSGGLPLLARDERDPMAASTYGVGLLLLDAVRRGALQIIVGLGGSATVDGGTGAAAAMGLRFEDAFGQAVTSGQNLTQIEKIDREGFDQLGLDGKITFLLDVNNPLCGSEGAAAIFGPQKGASQEQVWELDRGLMHLAGLIDQETGLNLADLPGIGAAGGFALPFVAFADAKMTSGINFVLDSLKFDEKLEGTDLVISGEGRTDAQSSMGKAISAVAERSQRNGVRVAVISGLLGEGAENLFALGVTDLVQATPPEQELEQALLDAEQNLRTASLQYFQRLLEEASEIEEL